MLTVVAVLSLMCVLTGVTVAGAETQTDDHVAVDTRPIVYLTFDDGPSADFVTDGLLQLLALYDATATFFVTGERVQREADKLAAIVYAGHAIGNHTFSHERLTLASDQKVLSELKLASELILAAGGPPVTCFRPPFGSTDDRVNGIATKLGMVPVGWSIDTRDWKKSITVEQITKALDGVSQESVILMHDGPSKRLKTLAALSAWMEKEAQNYRFQALPECDWNGEVVPLAEALGQEEKTVVAAARSTPQWTAAPGSAVTHSAKVSPLETTGVRLVLAPDLTPEPTPEPTITALLAKIRAYRFVLDDGGEPVDLEQVTATLNSEILGEHVFYSF